MLVSIRKFLMTTLLGGLLVLLPITIFAVLVRLVFRLVTNAIQPVAMLFSGSALPSALASILALAIIIGFCFFVGLFVRTRFGRAIIHYLNKQILARLPFYTTIQETVKQVFGQKGSSFSKVVIVEAMNTKMTGFVTSESPTGIYTVFVPTAPNPTNGFVFHVERDKLIFVEHIKAEDALRTVIGLGTGSNVLFEVPKESDEPLIIGD